MSFVDSMRLDRLIDQVEAIEARQRDHEWHDPSCPVRKTQIAQAYTGAMLFPAPCDCWLKEDDD